MKRKRTLRSSRSEGLSTAVVAAAAGGDNGTIGVNSSRESGSGEVASVLSGEESARTQSVTLVHRAKQKGKTHPHN